MVRQNCWEFKKCGRAPAGAKVAELGTCPAATDSTGNGVNEGKNGGSICWAVTGTFCGGQVQGSYAPKQASCMTCEFFKTVTGEESGKFALLRPGQKYQS